MKKRSARVASKLNLLSIPQINTVQQSAEFLGVSERTILRKIGSGELGSITIGRSRRIYREHLIDYLIANEQPAINPVALRRMSKDFLNEERSQLGVELKNEKTNKA